MAATGAAKLNAKQELFCIEYLVDLNGAQAAIRAGYSEKTAKEIASENLTKPNIADRIVELKAERVSRVLVDADYVVKGLLAVHERCMQAEPVMVRGDAGMEESGEFKFEHSGANKSLELLGRHLGLFVDKKLWNSFYKLTEVEQAKVLEVNPYAPAIVRPKGLVLRRIVRPRQVEEE